MSRIVMVRQGLPVPQDPRVWREARALTSAGHDVTVIASRAAGQRRRERIDGVDVRRYRCPAGTGFTGLAVETLAALLGCGRHLLALRLRGRIDVLHAFNPPDTLALLVWLLPGTRLVYDQADPVPELLRARGRAPKVLATALAGLEIGALRSASLVLAVNNTCRELARERGRRTADQVVVVRIGPEVLRSRRRTAADMRVTFAGVMGVQDGVEVLLQAAALLLRRAPGLCTFDLVGDGPDAPRLKELSASLGIATDVTWSGWLTGSAFTDRLDLATICVSPDADTEFNRLATMVKITDYLAAGMPCVVADLPETRVTCDDAVEYFPPGDAAALADVIERLLRDPAEREALAQSAAARAPRLLWEHSAARLQAAYAWLLNGAAAVAGEQRP